jgi:hypothetical protein
VRVRNPLTLVAISMSLFLLNGCANDSCDTQADCANGELCIANHCQAARPAENFCGKVQNPASQYHDSKRCLSQEKQRVVMLFFVLLA